MSQLTIDFDWADRRKWIVEAQLPTGKSHDGASVSPMLMAGVLNVINDHMGKNSDAWPSQATIAEKLKCSRRSVIRSLEALSSLSLVIIELRKSRSGVVCNHYRIVWTELQLLHPGRREAWLRFLKANASAPPERCDIAPDRCDITTDRCDTVTERCDTMSHEDKREYQKKETPPPTSPVDEWGEVEGVLFECGIAESTRAIESARRFGCPPADILGLIAYWRDSQATRPRRWNCPEAVLYRRVLRHRPGMAPTTGWPPGCPPEASNATGCPPSPATGRPPSQMNASDRAELVRGRLLRSCRNLAPDALRARLAAELRREGLDPESYPHVMQV